MQDLIASYLFQHTSCPLPGLGTLSLHTGAAVSDFTNKLIHAPVTAIQFEPSEANADELASYIARNANCDKAEAFAVLDQFCGGLKARLHEGDPATLDGIGEFTVNSNGDIVFQQQLLPADLLPTVTVERVIHPMAEHSILVGDKETTNTVMTGYFNDEPVVKDRWWVWAIILGAIGIALILYYFNDPDSSSLFGNAIKP